MKNNIKNSISFQLPECLCGRLEEQAKMTTNSAAVNDSHISSVQSLSNVQLFVTAWAAARQDSVSIPELTQTFVH